MIINGLLSTGISNLCEDYSVTGKAGSLVFFSSDTTDEMIQGLLEGNIEYSQFFRDNAVYTCAVKASTTLTASESSLVLDCTERPYNGHVNNKIVQNIHVIKDVDGKGYKEEISFVGYTPKSALLNNVLANAYYYTTYNPVSPASTVSSDLYDIEDYYDRGLQCALYLSDSRNRVADKNLYLGQGFYQSGGNYVTLRSFTYFMDSDISVDRFIFSLGIDGVTTPLTAIGVQVLAFVGGTWVQLGAQKSLESNDLQQIQFDTVTSNKFKIILYGNMHTDYWVVSRHFVLTSGVFGKEDTEYVKEEVIIDKAVFLPFTSETAKHEDTSISKNTARPMIAMSVGPGKDIDLYKTNWLDGDQLPLNLIEIKTKF